MTDVSAAHQALLERYRASHIGVFGLPGLVLTRGEGAYVWDVDGTRYLDLLGGIAVNALGHGHPELVAAISKQAGELVHVSNFFTTPAQIEAAEALLRVARAPHGSGVFFCNSGSEAVETAIKLSRRTGRTGIVAVGGAFHGRTTGAVSLTHKEAYRAPFEPLLPGVTHVAPGDVDALRVVSEGVNRAKATTDAGVLLITHYTRILTYIRPDFVHVFVDGRIAEEGGPELADRLEAEGYDRFVATGA